MVVEDSSCLDTSAIILKGTTVLTYKPRLLDRPFSGSLAGIEVTSPTVIALVHGQTLVLRLLILPLLAFIRILLIKEFQCQTHYFINWMMNYCSITTLAIANTIIVCQETALSTNCVSAATADTTVLVYSEAQYTVVLVVMVQESY